MNLFLAIFALGFLALAIWRLEWALGLTMILLPAYLLRFKIFGLPTTLLEVMILLSAAVWLWQNYWPLVKALGKNWHTKKVAYPYPFAWETIACLVLALSAVGIGGWQLAGFGIWRAYFFEPILFFLVAFNVFGRGGDWKKIIFPLSLSALLISVVAWYQQFIDLQFLNPVWSLAGRATSVFPYSNAVGLYLAPIIMLLVGWLFMVERQNIKLKAGWVAYYFIVILVALGAIVFARSDGAIIGLVAGFVVFGLLANRKTLAVTIALVLCVGATILSVPTYKQYVGDQLTMQNLSGQIRLQQWKETWQMLQQKNRWIWGAGLSGFQVAVAPYHQEGIFFNKDHDPNFHRLTVFNADYRATHWQPVEVYMYPHNIFLNFWSELGLLGALLFVWIIIKFWLMGILVLRKTKMKDGERYLILGLITAMLALVVHGLVDVPYFKNDLAVLFWLLLMMMGLVGHNTNTTNKRK